MIASFKISAEEVLSAVIKRREAQGNAVTIDSTATALKGISSDVGPNYFMISAAEVSAELNRRRGECDLIKSSKPRPRCKGCSPVTNRKMSAQFGAPEKVGQAANR